MSGRTATLAGALVFVAAFAALTVGVIVDSGFDVLVVISLVVLAMIAYGVIGALLHRPEE